jgi:predicted nuclease with TOPRIM domain
MLKIIILYSFILVVLFGCASASDYRSEFHEINSEIRVLKKKMSLNEKEVQILSDSMRQLQKDFSSLQKRIEL